MTEPTLVTPPVNKGMNTCLVGCLSLVALFVLMGVIAGIVAYVSLKSVYDQITESEPVALQSVELNPEEEAALQAKVDAFNAALENQSDERVFEFTGDELNALIGLDPEMEWLQESVYLQIVDSRIFGDVSLPLSKLGLPFERYLNGQATFDLAVSQGRLSVYVSELSVKGEPVSDEIMQGLANQNLGDFFYAEIESSNILDRIKSVTVGDDVISVTLFD